MYVLKVGNYYLCNFQTQRDIPSLNFISSLDFNQNKDYAYKFTCPRECDYMIDKLAECFDLFEDKKSIVMEKIEEN